MKFQTAPAFRKKDPGKATEAAVQVWLGTEAAADSAFAYHRYPDARAARGVLAAQPADFLVARKVCGVRLVWHLEVKETALDRRLPKAKLGQYGKLKMFWLAGIEPVVVIYRSSVKDWVYLSAAELFEHDECPASFPLSDLQSFPTLNDIMTEIFK